MKKAGILTLCGLVAAMLVGLTGTVEARPEYKKAHDGMHKDSKAGGALQDAKCNACHYGKKKENRNDYGKALADILEEAGVTKETYKDKKADKEAFAKVVEKALEKVLEKKNEDGETFGDRIKAGKLPGTNPEE